MIDSVYAICLLVEDFEKSLTFYSDVLGLKINSQDKSYTDFKFGEVLLAIFEKNEATTMFPKKYMNKGGGVVIALKVIDVQIAYVELKTKGIIFFEPPKTMSWGQTVAYFNDPDQNIIELTS